MTAGKRKTMILFTMIVYLLSGTCATMADDRLRGILEGIRAYYGKLPGLTVSYERDIVTRSMALLGQEMASDPAAGFIHFKPPQFLRVEQKVPQAEDVITDGDTLWWVVPDKKQVYRYPSHKMGRELKVLGDIFQGLRNIEESFNLLLLTFGVEGRHRIELKPNPPWPEVDHIIVTVDQDTSLIRVMEIHNTLGGFTRFTLGPITVRERFGEDFFKFKVPKGMKVIEEGE
jgi:outer membrane lipoprotein-sorting protein